MLLVEVDGISEGRPHVVRRAHRRLESV